MDGTIISSLQSFCSEFDSLSASPDRLQLINIPKHVDDVYADRPLDPLLVKSSYIQRLQKSHVVTFEACSYESDEDALYDVSFTCHGTLREKIVIPSPDEFSDECDLQIDLVRRIILVFTFIGFTTFYSQMRSLYEFYIKE